MEVEAESESEIDAVRAWASRAYVMLSDAKQVAVVAAQLKRASDDKLAEALDKLEAAENKLSLTEVGKQAYKSQLELAGAAYKQLEAQLEDAAEEEADLKLALTNGFELQREHETEIAELEKKLEKSRKELKTLKVHKQLVRANADDRATKLRRMN